MKEAKSPKKPLIFYYGVVLAVLLAFNMIVSPLLLERQVTEVDYGTFMRMIDDKDIGEVQMDDSEILFSNKAGDAVYKTVALQDSTLVQRLYEAGAKFSGTVEKTMSPLLSLLLTGVLPLLVFVALGQFLSRKLIEQAGGKNAMSFGMGKSNAKVYVQSSQGIHFSDVAGEDEAKESLAEIVDYLHNPQKYTEVGASMPKGVLLVGPPGTGKTMLAKAVAGEANVPFFSISGSEFVEMFVGMGASKVRDLFKQAKEKAPCIVFIDEIDAIGQKRNSGNMGGNDEREQTLNQLLTEMDGFEGNNGVIILAATNRPEALDPALTRPGRFDRRVPVELPDLAGPRGHFEGARPARSRPRPMWTSTSSRAWPRAPRARSWPTSSMRRRCARCAIGRTQVTQADLEESIEVVIAGYQKKNAVLSDQEKHVVAYHEIGHALVAALQSHSAPVQKITIIPRTSGALGYTMQVEEADKIPADQGGAASIKSPP